GQLPWPGVADAPVGAVDYGPDRGSGLTEVAASQRGIDQTWRPVARGTKGLPLLCLPARRAVRLAGHATPVLADQGDDPVHQVADSVRELVVCPGDEPVQGEIGVAYPRHVAEQPPAKRIGSVCRRDGGRIDGISCRLADLGAVGGEVIVHEYVARQR